MHTSHFFQANMENCFYFKTNGISGAQWPQMALSLWIKPFSHQTLRGLWSFADVRCCGRTFFFKLHRVSEWVGGEADGNRRIGDLSSASASGAALLLAGVFLSHKMRVICGREVPILVCLSMGFSRVDFRFRFSAFSVFSSLTWSGSRKLISRFRFCWQILAGICLVCSPMSQKS